MDFKAIYKGKRFHRQETANSKETGNKAKWRRILDRTDRVLIAYIVDSDICT